jgi:hypothetical protein
MTAQRAGTDRGGEPPDEAVSGRTVNRRLVLRAGALAGAAGLAVGLRGTGEESRPQLLSGGGANLTASLTRREDQLSLRFEFVNLVLLKAGWPGPGDQGTARLVRAVAGQPAYLIVHFGPQALGEFALDDGNAVHTTPVPVAPADGTRLAFLVPPDTDVIPYTVGELLAWHKYIQSVVPTAVTSVQGKPVPVEPTSMQTAICAPWSLVLSPHEQAGWAHRVALDGNPPGGRTELWHTRLAVRKPGGLDEEDATGRSVRAVWTPSFQRNAPPPPDGWPFPPGRTSLKPLNRYEIVRLTSDWAIISRTKPYTPQPLAVEQLALSPLGAWVKTTGDWPDVYDDELGRAFALESWVHRAAMGRDSYVRVVERGFLFPLGHRASRITVTERRFATVDDPASPQYGKPVAYLVQRTFLVVRDGERSYPAAPGPGASPGQQPYAGREMPFKTVRIGTQVTPDLLLPDDPANTSTRIPKGAGGYYGSDAFWPRVATGPGTSTDFLFPIAATDAEGRTANLLMPLVFVSINVSDRLNDVKAIIDAYSADPARVTVAMNGQQVALAAFPGGKPGECAYPMTDVTFGASPPEPATGSLDVFRQPRFFPRMAQARVRLEAVERVAGGTYGPQTVTLHRAWLNDPGHSARVFAALSSAVDLGFGADASGGVVTPDMRITGLSARTGPIGGDLSAPQPPAQFDPASFFGGAAPKILGGISLLDIIDSGGFDAGGGKAPRLVTTPVPGGVETSLTWRPTIKNDAAGVFVKSDTGALVVVAKTVIRSDGSKPTSEISGDVTDFAVNAVGSALQLVTVNFRRLAFVSANGTKPVIHADIAGVEFKGVLEFVNTLQQYLGSFGQGGGSGQDADQQDADQQGDAGSTGGGFIEVSTSGIRVGYSLGLPPLAVGVFSLENIAIGASLMIPFDGEPARVRFAFASREKPFLLTVSMFGGGGFVGVAFGLDKFELFEAALEFGAKLALDVGVASGGVSAVAGIYLALSADGGELTGYLRINGELEVLGLVHLAVEFYLGFTYDFGKKEAWGEATVTVEVDVLLFSGSVTLGPVRKRFAGGGGSAGGQAQAAVAGSPRAAAAKPALAAGTTSFADLIDPTDWADYSALYAPDAFA